MANKRFVVGLGEALWDVLPEGKKLGGAPANFAYHAGQFGLNTLAVSALGEDALAEIKENVAWDNIPYTPEIAEVAKNCRAVCFGSLAQRNVVSWSTIRQFLDDTPADCLKIFDINLRQQFYSKNVIEESFKRCNILKINDEELVVIKRMYDYSDLDMRGICEKILADYHLKMLVLTCGTNGSYVFAPGLTSFQDTPKVEVADTVGAGDSFTGSFCAAILNGKAMEEAHRIAVQVSAYVCTQKGAMPTYPEELLK